MCDLQHAIIAETQWSYEINGGTLITAYRMNSILTKSLLQKAASEFLVNFICR